LVTGLAQSFGGVKTFEEILLGLPFKFSNMVVLVTQDCNFSDLLVGAGSSFVVLPKAS